MKLSAISSKNEIKPWQKEMWCILDASAEYVACMADILDQYEHPYDPKISLGFCDEGLKQLIEETCMSYPG